MPEHQTKRIPITDLVEDPENSRLHPEENQASLHASLARFGAARSIVVDKHGVVRAGNGTIEQARKLGIEEVIVVETDGRAVVAVSRPDWSDEEATAYAIADNRTAELAKWDPDQLRESLSSLPALGFEAMEDVMQFSVGDLAETIGVQGYTRRKAVEEDEVPEPPKVAVTKPGDVWQLGRHRVVCGDCCGVEIPTVDFAFTSPPYNVDIQYDEHDDAHRDASQYLHWIRSVASNVIHSLRDGCAIAWNIGVSPRTYPHRQVCVFEDEGVVFRKQYVWAKVGIPIPTWHVSTDRMLARHVKSNFTHEMIFVFSKGEFAYGPKTELSEDLRDDVIHIRRSEAGRDVPKGNVSSGEGKNSGPNRSSNKAHPAMFPVTLPASFMQCYSAPSETVLDPFLGSGTTLVAAEQLDRICYGVEISPQYCDVIVERWENLTGGKATRSAG